jgi:uroporphyrinogen-III synthase
MENKVQVLSTKKLSDSFAELAAEHNICIDQLNFIEIQECVSQEIKNKIADLSTQQITAIFTSSNAVKAVGNIVSTETNWKIFCIAPSTKHTLENVFKNSVIKGAAKDAAELSQKILKDKSVKNVVFFCGNQRRDLLPLELKNSGIDVEEVVVYKTIEKPQNVAKDYEGILFFSPSGVRSFFAKNKLTQEAKIFAIGKTTAEEVKKFSSNTTIISTIPDTGKLIEEVIKYFSIIKTV